MFSYLFSSFPGEKFEYSMLLYIIAGVFFFGSFGIQYLLKKQRDNKIFKRMFTYVPGRMRALGVSLAIVLFARANNVVIFSMRFLFFLVLAWFVYSFGKMTYLYFVTYPKESSKMDIPKKSGKSYSTAKKRKAK